MPSGCAKPREQAAASCTPRPLYGRARPGLGRQRAHDVVYDACRSAVTEQTAPGRVLIEMPEIRPMRSAARMPSAIIAIRANYLGLAPQWSTHIAEPARLANFGPKPFSRQASSRQANAR